MTLVGKLFKIIIPDEMIVPILMGRLKGKKWVISSSNIECALGTYEYKKHILFAKEISISDVVYDIGAHAGFYTLLASEIVGFKGSVVAFEPLPQNFFYLKKHVEINQTSNVIINNVAVTNFIGVSSFRLVGNTYTGRLDDNGEIEVETISLNDFVLKNPDLIPDCIKIDVEGSEYDVLKGASHIISNNKPKIFLATHNEFIHKKCVDFLKSYNYNLESINNQNDEIFAYYNIE